jgi:pyruvate dehydrogenase E2 component (dihydrolipoamide acetyltransferase)
MPDLGEGISEVEVVAWCVAVGDVIAEDAPLLEVQTDKAMMDIPSPFGGTVLDILVEPGTTVAVGTPLVVVGSPEAARAEVAAPAAPRHAVARAPAPGTPVRASPFVRRLAADLGVDLADVHRAEPGGHVTEADLRGWARANLEDDDPAGGEALTGVRRLTSLQVTRAHQEIPAVTIVDECDFSNVPRVALSYLPSIVHATAQGLREFPELNASMAGDRLVMHERIDLGLAVQTDDGLLVPVIRAADEIPEADLPARIRELTRDANERRLAPGELRGSTFTITAAGRRGGLFATPLINHPQVGILGVHRITDRAVVRRGKVVVARVGYLSFTFDHRAVDGLRAGAFLQRVIRGIRRAPDASR